MYFKRCRIEQLKAAVALKHVDALMLKVLRLHIGPGKKTVMKKVKLYDVVGVGSTYLT